jgi:hypothetical protein
MARTRRQFLAALGAAAAFPGEGWTAPAVVPKRPRLPREIPEIRPGRATLANRFPDLRRHFVFEYYPWYGGPPDYVHWDFWNRRPPDDLASPYVPHLGAYDVRDRRVLEQHARWIADSGVGGVALSWWGRGSWEDRTVHLIMDVFDAHDLKVTFALEPYRDDRGKVFASDVLYLLREYGEKRGWDAFLMLRNADGSEGPVFKGFRCIVPPEATDCHGVTRPVADYTADETWRAQIEGLRDTLRGDFHHVTLLADAVELTRPPRGGFDGIGVYDNFIPPTDYARYAAGASVAGLVFSFNVNPGFDSIEPRFLPDCYTPQRFAPPTEGLDWGSAGGRERAAGRSAERIRESFEATVAVQTDPELINARRGFFLVYVNSFNEWHEGHAFEPMKDAADLTPPERALGYHNPEQGAYRLATLRGLVERVGTRVVRARQASTTGARAAA